MKLFSNTSSNIFTGDYNTFYKFFGGYARNKTLELTRKYKSGVCACCGAAHGEIQSAHKRGCERVDLVKKCFEQSIISQTKDGICQVDLDKFEKLFVDFSSDLSNFYFLCEKCHTNYDHGKISETDFKHIANSIKHRPTKKLITTITGTPRPAHGNKVSSAMRSDNKLKTMGKSWFVSYMYYLCIDTNHRNWKDASFLGTRKSAFKGSKSLHKDYLAAVLASDDGRLGTNEIGLSGTTVKDMARKLLNNWDKVSQSERYKYLLF